MKQFQPFLPVMILGFLVLGCAKTTPEGALGSALKAIDESDLSELKDVLHGEADDRFGNKQGLLELRKYIVNRQPTDATCTLSQKSYLFDYYSCGIQFADEGVSKCKQPLFNTVNVMCEVTNEWIQAGTNPNLYCKIYKFEM